MIPLRLVIDTNTIVSAPNTRLSANALRGGSRSRSFTTVNSFEEIEGN